VTLAFPIAMFVNWRYRHEADGLLFGVAVGMGFAALETMGYALVSFVQSGGDLVQVLSCKVTHRGVFPQVKALTQSVMDSFSATTGKENRSNGHIPPTISKPNLFHGLNTGYFASRPGDSVGNGPGPIDGATVMRTRDKVGDERRCSA